jgi:hypothetical protein
MSVCFFEIASLTLLNLPNTMSEGAISKTKERQYLLPALTAATARRLRNKTIFFIFWSLAIRLAFGAQNAVFIVIIRVFTGVR